MYERDKISWLFFFSLGHACKNSYSFRCSVMASLGILISNTWSPSMKSLTALYDGHTLCLSHLLWLFYSYFLYFPASAVPVLSIFLQVSSCPFSPC